jgi:hypothetical protein
LPTSTAISAIVLCPATFVELTADQERCAIGALAELLVPLLGEPPRAIPDPVGVTPVTTVGDT